MTNSDRLQLPLIESNQAQKHITHNEALRMLDAFLHLTLEALGINDPPAAPSVGSSWQVGQSPTGDWSMKAGLIASFDANGWQFLSPPEGAFAWVKSTKELFVCTSAGWAKFDQAPSSVQNAEFIGIGTSADAYNKLAVKSDGAYMTAADGGSGDARLTVNKNSTGNTASVTFKNAWSSRAEMGLAGDDAFSIKVSDDGSLWRTAATFDPLSGRMAVPSGVSHESKGMTQKINIIPDCGRFASDKTRTISSFVSPSYLVPENAASISEYSKFNFDSADYGGAGAANNATVKLLVDQIRDPSSARYMAEFYVAKLTAGAGTAYENTQSGSSKYRVCSYDRIGGNRQSLSAYFYVLSGAAVISASNHEIWLNGAKISDFAQVQSSDGWQHINAISDISPRYASHQEAELLPLFATSGVQILLALPAIIPDAVRVGPDDGMIPSLSVTD